MTKTYDLKMGGDGTYYSGQRKALCTSFVSKIVGRTPANITVKLSDTKFDGAWELAATRTGRYRWFAQCCGRPWEAMWLIAEEELGSFYPLAKDDPPDDGGTELTFWLSISES